MKFSLFVHMERISPDEDQKQLYDQMIALDLIADAGGMHAIWMGEHHAMNFTIAPNPLPGSRGNQPVLLLLRCLVQERARGVPHSPLRRAWPVGPRARGWAGGGAGLNIRQDGVAAHLGRSDPRPVRDALSRVGTDEAGPLAGGRVPPLPHQGRRGAADGAVSPLFPGDTGKNAAILRLPSPSLPHEGGREPRMLQYRRIGSGSNGANPAPNDPSMPRCRTGMSGFDHRRKPCRDMMASPVLPVRWIDPEGRR